MPSAASSTRRSNLKKLLTERFKGSIAALGRAIDRDDAYVWQLLRDGKGGRNIGERIARHIEAKLGMERGALDVEGMVATEGALKPDERELLERYRRASPSWRIALRYLANLQGDVQDEISQSVNILLSKVSAEHVADDVVERAYGHRPDRMHERQAHYSAKKKS